MNLVNRLLQNSDERKRRGGARPTLRAHPTTEHLEHRQLLAVNFTGNVTTDFSSTDPGVVIARPDPNDPSYSIPLIPGNLQGLVPISGFQLDAIRLRYDPAQDVLQIGLEQPPNQVTGQPVIASDADDNLVDGTVSPAVLAVENGFLDPQAIGGSETMLVYANLNPDQDDIPDIVAGVDSLRNSTTRKSYQVALFNVNADPEHPNGSVSPFGTFLPVNTGAAHFGNDPLSPNFEFTINNFSQLYQQVTGRALTLPANITIGAFAGSDDDAGISEAYIPPLAVALPQTPVDPECPPQSPQVLINPHSQQHINTFHDTRIRVNILGTSGFDVSQIDPSTVRLGGAAPIYDRVESTNSDQWADRLFVFNGLDVDLPRGPQDAVVTGQLYDGTRFESAARVYNQPGFFTIPKNDNKPVPLKPLQRNGLLGAGEQQPGGPIAGRNAPAHRAVGGPRAGAAPNARRGPGAAAARPNAARPAQAAGLAQRQAPQARGDDAPADFGGAAGRGR